MVLQLTENDAKIEEYLSDKPWDDKFLSGECEAVEVTNQPSCDSPIAVTRKLATQRTMPVPQS